MMLFTVNRDGRVILSSAFLPFYLVLAHLRHLECVYDLLNVLLYPKVSFVRRFGVFLTVIHSHSQSIYGFCLNLA